MGRSERGSLEQGGSRGFCRNLGQRAALSYWLWRGQAGQVGLGNAFHTSWMNATLDIDCLHRVDERGAESMGFGAYFLDRIL